jgi:predicted DsbA family dithiol-disulfide isomerase
MNLDERIKYAAMKARHRKKLRPWYKKTWGVLIIILIIIFLLISTIFTIRVFEASKKINEPVNYSPEMAENFLKAIDRPSANTYGPENALVQIIEFSDFACEYCRDSYLGLKYIRQKYGDEVRIVYRDFPLHENSIFLSLAARCAGEQGEFWKMHDLFFENQNRFNVSQTELKLIMPEIAEALKLEVDKFKTCLDSQKYFPQINQDYKDSDFLQIQGTPTWFINNVPFTGHLTKEQLEQLVLGIINSENQQQE